MPKAQRRRPAYFFTTLVLLGIILLQQPLAVFAQPVTATSRSDFLAQQCADILGLAAEFARYQSIEPGTAEFQDLRRLMLRRMLFAYLEIRQAVNKTEAELDWTYGLVAREHARHNAVNEAFNAANFAQFSVLYTLEPYARMHMHFKESAVLTCVGAGVGTAIPIAGIIYNKTVRAHDTAPPKVLASMVDGRPVDGKDLPPLVAKFLDTPDFGADKSRREQMFVQWNERYHVDPSNISSLCGLEDNRPKTNFVLNNRILLLWSLHTFIEKFDEELGALICAVRKIDRQSNDEAENQKFETARYLKISPRADEIESLLGILSGMLEVRQAADKVDSDLNYAYDVVLSNLLMRRGKALQKNFDIHFIETGVFGGVAGLLYLKEQPKAGNEMFVISSAIGICLSTAALWQLRGGKRPIDSPPNALSSFFDYGRPNQYSFTPVMYKYISAHRDEIISDWKSKRVSNVSIDNIGNRKKLDGTDANHPDTIKIVRSRIALLHALRTRLEKFDFDLYNYAISINPASDLGRLIVSALDVRTTLDRLDDEISREKLAADRLSRDRDLAVTLTNNANFFQINILGIIADGPLGLSASPANQLAGNHLNIVSGIMAGGLAGAALMEQSGGIRSGRTPPNSLGAALGLPDTCGISLSPELQQFIAQRRSPLLAYWKKSKVINVDVSKIATLQKLAACGKAHHFYNERIKLINNRLRMLYDVKALLGQRVVDLLSGS
ncbi:MAG TPA: hypothetical protein V6C89_20640 [Drouetiella sp.]